MIYIVFFFKFLDLYLFKNFFLGFETLSVAPLNCVQTLKVNL